MESNFSRNVQLLKKTQFQQPLKNDLMKHKLNTTMILNPLRTVLMNLKHKTKHLKISPSSRTNCCTSWRILTNWSQQQHWFNWEAYRIQLNILFSVYNFSTKNCIQYINIFVYNNYISIFTFFKSSFLINNFHDSRWCFRSHS